MMQKVEENFCQDDSAGEAVTKEEELKFKTAYYTVHGRRNIIT